MNTDFEGKLTYRDYVVHIFTGVIFNVFLLAALFPVLPDKWWEYDLQNEVVWSLVAIPILYLEGQFIHTINRAVMVDVFKNWFILRVKYLRRKQEKKHGNTNDDAVSKYSKEHYRTAAYKRRMEWHERLYKKHKFWYFLLLSARISGQKVVKKDKLGDIVKTTKTELTTRYYILSDFFKGVCCAAVLVLPFVIWLHNWLVLGIMLFIILLSRQRARFYSMMYVRFRYKKKGTKKEQETDEKANSTN